MSRVQTYDIGDTVRFSVAFRDINKALADPTTVSLATRQPNGAETTYSFGGGTVLKDSTGSYHADISLTSSGRWSWKWTGTGTVAAVDEGALFVDQTAF